MRLEDPGASALQVLEHPVATGASEPKRKHGGRSEKRRDGREFMGDTTGVG